MQFANSGIQWPNAFLCTSRDSRLERKIRYFISRKTSQRVFNWLLLSHTIMHMMFVSTMYEYPLCLRFFWEGKL